ncbi:HAMP domain-containing sensor histidine kinase [Corynebacterium guangdongense]|uniref:histidine kinase n=1 Tax=Corynebacterium guangdongense TaxID=1783348 RepID=A0ABU1ZY83_9CORY|nr:HAMP domain-containing sensor histidine kinase [Corynebacterium guangdongense]MDR7328833.1 two-component system sensor histidine kinase MprB [Corynebacterium guangdongense]WJZ17408.1 Signal transduction histidine-protein kinase/phosphatase MprB [Corynebacterium guangdongense]
MLRKPIPHPEIPGGSSEPVAAGAEGAALDDGTQGSSAASAGAQAPLRWRLAMLTAMVVAVAVGAMTVVTYWTISASVTAAVDHNLDVKADPFIERAADPEFFLSVDEEIANFKRYNPDIRVSIATPQNAYVAGDNIPAGDVAEGGGAEAAQGTDGAEGAEGGAQTSARTVGHERILTQRAEGVTVVLAQNMDATHQLIAALGAVLLVITALGVLLSIAAGMVVATAGLRPLSRVQRAVEYVTRTDDLRPIQVVGNDELAQLTRSFNAMLAALQDSRNRQTQLVADAGHELKTPLTSIRTNIDLLIMLNHSGEQHRLSESDMRDLENDVRAQLDEMSRLIGDLVDLAREETPIQQVSETDVEEVLFQSINRVQRRRPDVTFDVESVPWLVMADPASLGRVMVNLLDNAGKWSPKQGTVRVALTRIGPDTAELSVADSGPGIAEQEREAVFERFYRSTESRSMPGSGLGLAIVKQVVDRLGGTIVAEESADGGTLMRATLPGHAPLDDEEGDSARTTLAPDSEERGVAFTERWFTGWQT